MTTEYTDGEVILARHIPEAEAWKGGLNFFSQDQEYVQVGSWGYDTGFEAGAGDVVILLRGGHGYDIIEDGTQVLEVKNGPYLGAEADRRRI